MTLNKSSLFLSLLSLLLFSGCNDPLEKPAATSLPPVEVEVETLAPSEVPIQVELAGTLQAVENITVSARVAGQIVELPVKIGSKVKKGDLLIKIAAAEINARVQQAETQLAQARRNLARETRLQEVNASTRTKVKTLAELVQINEAVYREAQAILGYTQIRAPFAGTVTGKPAARRRSSMAICTADEARAWRTRASVKRCSLSISSEIKSTPARNRAWDKFSLSTACSTVFCVTCWRCRARAKAN